MTLAFDHRITRPRGAGALAAAVVAVALVGAALTILRLYARFGGIAAVAAAAICLALVMLGVARLRGAPTARRLEVDAAGRARLTTDGQTWHCMPQRWLLADGWVAMRVRLECNGRDGSEPTVTRTMDLLSGPGDDAHAWRGLRVWLGWLQRGQLPDGSYDESSVPPAHTEAGEPPRRG